MKKKLTKKIIKYIIVPMFCVSLSNTYIFKAYDAYAATTLYEKKEQGAIGKGIIYESKKMITDKGMLDVYVLRVPVKDPYIKIKPVESTQDSQLKETTSKLLSDNGAIAGINGDFFNMKGSYSWVVGPVVKDGVIEGLDRFNNLDKNEYATFFIDNQNNPFIQYVRAEPQFLNNGVENIKVFTMNKVTDMAYAAYIDRNFAYSTRGLDTQFAGMAKIVVEDGIVTYISQKGESVDVPENGFVILISNESADYFTTLVNVGDTAEMKINATVDFDNIQSAIGGGGKILQDGKIVVDSGFVATGRQPRTAVGYNKEGTELYLMVVDGRGTSIGASHDELANLMADYGAYNAMHLDGGGSSTMAIKKINEDELRVVNTPSDGGQRKVGNALGVFSEAPAGKLSMIGIKPASKVVFKNAGIPLNFIGYDEYYNILPVEQGKVSLAISDSNSKFENGNFYPSKTGLINVTASYNGVKGEAVIDSRELAEIVPSHAKINAGVGGKTYIDFNGKSTDGFSSNIYSGIKFEVVPKEIGHMEGNTFVGDKLGLGYIKCTVGDVTAYVDVNVGREATPVTGFEENREIAFIQHPLNVIDGVEEEAIGYVEYTNDVVAEGKRAIKMEYALKQSDETQAAYLMFPEGILLQDGTVSLNVSVYGDNSFHWLRGKIIDADGKEVLIDLAKEIDWEGWKEINVDVSKIKYPAYLERLYVASTSNIDTNSYKIYFDKITSDVVSGNGKVEHPANTTINDTANASFNKAVGTGFDISIMGSVSIRGDKKPENYNEQQNRVINIAKQNAAHMLFAGFSDVNYDIGVDYFNWNENYAIHSQSNVAIVHLTAAKGGLYATNLNQWGRFYNDIMESGKEHVIIEMDISPSSFKSAYELEIFQDALEKIAASGKSVFVISTEGTSNSQKFKDGVRYFNLGGLWGKDGSVNSNMKVLRLRVNGSDISYSLQNIE